MKRQGGAMGSSGNAFIAAALVIIGADNGDQELFQLLMQHTGGMRDMVRRDQHRLTGFFRRV